VSARLFVGWGGVPSKQRQRFYRRGFASVGEEEDDEDPHVGIVLSCKEIYSENKV
jgi:hypothetical protein